MTQHALIDRIYGNKDNARFWLAIDRLRAAMCQEEQLRDALKLQGQPLEQNTQPRFAEQTQARAKLALADVDHSLRLN